MQPKDLIAPEIEIKLAKLDQPLKVRHCTLADDIWAEQKFQMPIEQVLLKPSVETLIQVFFRLLETESKELFLIKEVKTVDDDGNLGVVKIGGADLLGWYITGGRELIDVSRCMLESVGFSRPQLDAAEAEFLKKNSNLGSLSPAQGGTKPSTSSVTNTGGQPNMSSAERSGKSSGAARP